MFLGLVGMSMARKSTNNTFSRFHKNALMFTQALELKVVRYGSGTCRNEWHRIHL